MRSQRKDRNMTLYELMTITAIVMIIVGLVLGFYMFLKFDIIYILNLIKRRGKGEKK